MFSGSMLQNVAFENLKTSGVTATELNTCSPLEIRMESNH